VKNDSLTSIYFSREGENEGCRNANGRKSKKTMESSPGTEGYKQPPVEHIISDHAGTVLDEPEPEPSLTKQEKQRATNLFQLNDKDGTGLTLEVIRKVLPDIDIDLDDDLFTQYVVASVLKDGSDPSLPLDEAKFLDMVSTVYAPGHQYGPRLRKACGRADNALAKDLIQRGCNPVGCDGGGCTSLHYAAQFGHVSTIEMLLEAAKDADELLNAKDKSDWTPLMVAAAYGQRDATAALLEKGANVSSVSVEGRTALHWACAKGKEGILILLASAGIDVNAVDSSGWTALHCAMTHGHIKTASQLVAAHGADMEVEDRIGNTAESYTSPESWQALKTELEKKRGQLNKKKVT
jgi:hypothetical protein